MIGILNTHFRLSKHILFPSCMAAIFVQAIRSCSYFWECITIIGAMGYVPVCSSMFQYVPHICSFSPLNVSLNVCIGLFLFRNLHFPNNFPTSKMRRNIGTFCEELLVREIPFSVNCQCGHKRDAANRPSHVQYTSELITPTTKISCTMCPTQALSTYWSARRIKVLQELLHSMVCKYWKNHPG